MKKNIYNKVKIKCDTKEDYVLNRRNYKDDTLCCMDIE